MISGTLTVYNIQQSPRTTKFATSVGQRPGVKIVRTSDSSHSGQSDIRAGVMLNVRLKNILVSMSICFRQYSHKKVLRQVCKTDSSHITSSVTVVCLASKLLVTWLDAQVSLYIQTHTRCLCQYRGNGFAYVYIVYFGGMGVNNRLRRRRWQVWLWLRG